MEKIRLDKAVDWNLVRTFLAAARAGSLSGAARTLGTTQPTVSRQIAEFESRLGVALFERTGRGLRATDAARAMLDHAIAMGMAADGLALAASAREQAIEGSVRVTASEMIAAFVLPDLLAELRRQQPGIRIEIVASDAVSNLLQREADIAIRMVRPVQTSLIARKLGELALGAFAHRRYLMRRGTPERAEDLLQHDLIGYDRNDDIVRGFRSYGIAVDPGRFVIRTDNQVVYWQAVQAGLGIGFTSLLSAARSADIVQVVPGLRITPLGVWLAVHREIRSNPRIRLVYDFLADAMARVLRSQ